MDMFEAFDCMDMDTVGMTYEFEYIKQTKRTELMNNLQAQGRIKFLVLLRNMRFLIRILKHMRKNKRAQEKLPRILFGENDTIRSHQPTIKSRKALHCHPFLFTDQELKTMDEIDDKKSVLN